MTTEGLKEKQVLNFNAEAEAAIVFFRVDGQTLVPQKASL